MNIREEFLFSDVEKYLIQNISSVIIGNRSEDERCNVILDKFRKTNARIIYIDYDKEKEKILIQVQGMPSSMKPNVDSFSKFLIEAMKGASENVLVDLTSLQHAVIILLMYHFSQSIKPARLFASYVKPQRYIAKDELGQYAFSSQIYEPSGIPGLIRQTRDHEIVIPFLGFEGERLNNIIESMSYESIIPIIGFPSEDPLWKFEALRNCMKVANNMSSNTEIKKCKASSIFDAFALLEDIRKTYPEKNYVLLPLGIRTHTAACGLWASKYKNVRIVFDYATEMKKRSEGIGDIIIYHLSRLIT